MVSEKSHLRPGVAENITLFFAVMSLGFLGLFFWNPFRDKGFSDIVRVSNSKLDLGDIAPGKRGIGEFTLTNRTKQPLPFKVSADCSCTIIEPAAGEIEPTSFVKIRVEFKPKSASSLASSLHLENSNVMVSVLQGGRKLTSHVAVNARALLPFLVDPNQMTRSVEPFQATDVELELNFASDVEAVQLVNTPDFLQDVRLVRDGNRFRLRGTVDKLPGVYHGELEFESKIRGIDQPVLARQSASILVKTPYQIKSPISVLYNGATETIRVEPTCDGVSVELVETISDCPEVQVFIDENDRQILRVRCDLGDQASIPLFGKLDFQVQITRSSGEKMSFRETLSFVVSEGLKGHHEL